MEIFLAVYLTSVFHNFMNVYVIAGASGDKWYKDKFYWIVILSGTLSIIFGIVVLALLEHENVLSESIAKLANDIEENNKEDQES